MSKEDLSIGDEKVTADDFIQQQNEAADIVSKIESSVKITDADKKKADARAKDELDDAQEVMNLASDLSAFISDKIDIDDIDGGIIDKFPTGLDLLDAIAGGGFGVGTFTMIIGNPGTFKSALMAQTIGAGQKKYNGRMLATYHDSEHSMTQDRLSNMGATRPIPKVYSDVTVENVFQTIECVAAFKQLRNIIDVPAVVAWDSIANTSTAKERTTDDINQTIGLKARLLSGLFPRYIPKMAKNKISLIAVNQLREKLDMGMFSQPADLQHMGNKDIPGGQALKFNAFHLLHLRNRGDIKFDQYGFNGIKLEAHFVKNKFFQPNIPVMLIVDFNTGVSNFWSNYQFLCDNKRIKAGAWNNFESDALKNSWRTKDAKEMHENDEAFRIKFDTEVKETIDREIIVKYSVKK